MPDSTDLNSFFKVVDRMASQRRRSVVIGLPFYDRKCDVDFATSLADTLVMAAQLGVQVFRLPVIGDCYIHKARNTLVQAFIGSDATDFVFIDTDLGWNPVDFFRLLQLPYDLSIACYPYKKDEEGYPVDFEVDAKGEYVRDPDTGCYSVVTAPTGFMRITRKVFEQMAPRCAEYDLGGQTFRDYFKTPIVGRNWFGEDVYFVREWLAMGNRAWCLPDVPFRHIGTKSWDGNIGAFIARGGKPTVSPHPLGANAPSTKIEPEIYRQMLDHPDPVIQSAFKALQKERDDALLQAATEKLRADRMQAKALEARDSLVRLRSVVTELLPAPNDAPAKKTKPVTRRHTPKAAPVRSPRASGAH